jgi:hypothetical protein
MDVTFPFVVDANAGECRIGFAFSGSTRSIQSNSELVFESIKWQYDETPNADAKKKIASTVQHALRSIVEQKYQLTISERVKAAEPA